MVKNAFLKTSEQELSCIRGHIAEALKRELVPCLKEKLGENFQVPEIPDFDAGLTKIREKLYALLL